jgi:hypothetical protein
MTIATTQRAIDAILSALDPEQRAAATLPDGPAQIIAPAGSGKTTTLIARLGLLLSRGVAAERIAVATFNREAAEELRSRIRRRAPRAAARLGGRGGRGGAPCPGRRGAALAYVLPPGGRRRFSNR